MLLDLLVSPSEEIQISVLHCLSLLTSFPRVIDTITSVEDVVHALSLLLTSANVQIIEVRGFSRVVQNKR